MERKSMWVCLLLLNFVFCQEDELILSVIYARHGARLPKLDIVDWNTFPFDLTAGGMRQHYLLGRELRHRYIDKIQFLDQQYNYTQISVRAKQVDRTVASAYTLLSGLYLIGSGKLLSSESLSELAVPPNEFDFSEYRKELEIGAINYTYQAIPVHSYEGRPDFVMDASNDCPAIKQMINQYEIDNKEEILQYEKDNFKDLYHELQELFHISTPMNRSQACNLRDLLICGLHEGKYMRSEEYTKDVINRTLPIYQYAKYEMANDISFGDWKVSRLISTEFISLLISIIKEKIAGANPTKLALFVGSDTLMHSFMRELGYSRDRKKTPFASVFIWELFRKASSEDQNPDYYIKITYNHVQLDILPIKQFFKIYTAIVYEKNLFEEFCNSFDPNNFGSSLWIYAIIVASGIVLGVLLFLIINFRNHFFRCRKSTDREELE